MYSTTRLPLSRWVHLAGTYDGATMRLYIDGELAASATASGAVVPSTADLQIGAGYAWFRGDLDEVRIYDRALTLAELTDEQTRPVDPALPLIVTGRSPEHGAIGVRAAPLSATFGLAMSAEPDRKYRRIVRVSQTLATPMLIRLSSDPVPRRLAI